MSRACVGGPALLCLNGQLEARRQRKSRRSHQSRPWAEGRIFRAFARLRISSRSGADAGSVQPMQKPFFAGTRYSSFARLLPASKMAASVVSAVVTLPVFSLYGAPWSAFSRHSPEVVVTPRYIRSRPMRVRFMPPDEEPVASQSDR